MMDLPRYEKLKARVDAARREHDRAVGARDQLRKRLLDEHGCPSLMAAEQELARLRGDASRLAAEFEAGLAEFESEWDGKLGNDEGNH